MTSSPEDRQTGEPTYANLASLGDGVVVMDTQGRVTFLNPAAENLTRWTLAEALGQPLGIVFRLLHEESREPLENPAIRTEQEKVVVPLDSQALLLARDGTEVPLAGSVAPILTSDSQLSGMVLLFRDVTEARRALEARLYLASIVESSEDAIIGKSLDGRIVSWNQGAERLYGYSAAEIVGQPLTLLVPSDHPDELPEIIERISTGERIEHYETVRLRKDGQQIAVALTISPVRNKEGKIIGASKIARDITEQKQSEADSRRHTHRFRLLWESAAVLLSTEAPDQMLQALFAQIAPHLELDIYFNHLAREDGEWLELASCVGISDEGVARATLMPVGRGIAGHAAATLKDAVYEHIQEASDERTEFARQLGLRVCYCSALVVEGRLLGTLAYGSRRRDRFDSSELEFLRTLSQYATVAYDKLRLVDQLKEADRRKDHFLAVLAHELRNPLAPIRNGLQVLKLANIENPMVQRTQAVMERQLSQMVRLIDDLLDLSRISRGKITLQKKRFDFAEAVQGAIETSRPAIEANRHELIVSLPQQPLPIDADATRLVQVIANLLHNAAKFTPDGGQISVTVDRHGNEVSLSVKDNGVGIPASMLGQIFDVFTQVDRSIERAQGGLGIGLSLVKGLVELHGGRVEVKSEGDGQGSEFIAHLPLAMSETERPSSLTEEAIEPAGTGLRILVVDDNVDAAMTLSLLFQIMHHDIRLAHNGLDAIEAADAYRPDLILMDIGMPGMNGYDACRRVRAQKWSKGCFMVALTGWGQEEDKRLSREAGFDSHLVKPVEPATLIKLVSELATARGLD